MSTALSYAILDLKEICQRRCIASPWQRTQREEPETYMVTFVTSIQAV